jgi:hypothetical protein
MMKTRARNFKQSGHYMTAARLVHAAVEAGRQGNLMLQKRLLGKVGRDGGEQRSLNQRQKRKARRQRWAAGDRTAFAA